jgi:hypothetical protein
VSRVRRHDARGGNGQLDCASHAPAFHLYLHRKQESGLSATFERTAPLAALRIACPAGTSPKKAPKNVKENAAPEPTN